MKRLISRMMVIVAGVFLLVSHASVQAQAEIGSLATQHVDAQSVEAWATKTLGGAVEAGRISGAVISVVKDGEVIFEKGYGLGDVVDNIEASPVSTRVRIGSTTKTFTATLIAQLMEDGIITSLDDPVNKYLKRYSLPDNEGVSITLKHLLTHTAGFEDRFFFIGSDRSVEIPVSADLFDSLRPAYVRPAGEAVVYSNFGVATLGLVIEDQLSAPIDQIMKARIFEPLNMQDTALLVDIDEPAGLARPGRLDVNGVVGPTPFTAINPAVAQTGSIVSTAHDMAQYMNAHLGHYPDFSAALRARLQQRLMSNASDLSGLGMVFFVDDWAGHKTVSHGGNWAGFHTWMTLLPEENTGFFVTLLSDASPVGVKERFMGAAFPDRAAPPSPALMSASSISSNFLASFFGPKRPLPKTATVDEDLGQYVGLYRSDRRSFSTVEALTPLVYFGGGELEVSVQKGGLYVGAVGPWLTAGNGRFVFDAPTRPIVVFEKNERTGEWMLLPEIGIYTFTKTPPWKNPKLHAIAIHILIPLTILGLLSPVFLGLRLSVLASLMVGASGLILTASALVGLQPGDTMMTGYFGGYVMRLGVFAFGANLMLIASVSSILVGSIGSGQVMKRGWALLIGIIGAISTAILIQYNSIGINF